MEIGEYYLLNTKKFLSKKGLEEKWRIGGINWAKKVGGWNGSYSK